jgi:hypothetical protein
MAGREGQANAYKNPPPRTRHATPL